MTMVLAVGMSIPDLHDGRGQQHVVLAVVEGVHPVIELTRRHLAMGGHEAHLRHLFAQEILDPRRSSIRGTT
jgi:hypothetical protein